MWSGSPATATVLGLFEDWDCSVAECELASGDVLVIYTDGITEAGPNEQEEFGEEHLIVTTRKHQRESAAKILDAILDEVHQISRGKQADDMTLIVTGCHSGSEKDPVPRWHVPGPTANVHVRHSICTLMQSSFCSENSDLQQDRLLTPVRLADGF